MEPLPAYSSGRSEMHSTTGSHMALQRPLLHCILADVISIHRTSRSHGRFPFKVQNPSCRHIRI
uniref:Uncharacterized protein n=1 Tax=Arundo donax TaxID=35708 RepID=A0A0A9DJQ1_ARUDO